MISYGFVLRNDHSFKVLKNYLQPCVLCGREVYSFIKKSNREDGEKFVRGLRFFWIDFSASPGSCGHTGSLPPVLRVRHVRGRDVHGFVRVDIKGSVTRTRHPYMARIKAR